MFLFCGASLRIFGSPESKHAPNWSTSYNPKFYAIYFTTLPIFHLKTRSPWVWTAGHPSVAGQIPADTLSASKAASYKSTPPPSAQPIHSQSPTPIVYAQQLPKLHSLADKQPWSNLKLHSFLSHSFLPQSAPRLRRRGPAYTLSALRKSEPIDPTLTMPLRLIARKTRSEVGHVEVGSIPLCIQTGNLIFLYSRLRCERRLHCFRHGWRCRDYSSV